MSNNNSDIFFKPAKRLVKKINKPVVSLVASAYRTDNWMSIYNNFGKPSLVDLEFIFVGPNKPNYELPENFRFIQSAVKPIQCLEIAARNAIGDFIIQISDDCLFKTKHPIDELYKTFLRNKSEKIIVSCRYSMDDKLLPVESCWLIKGDPKSPLMPLSGLMKRSLYNKLGGMDKNFIAIMGDLDIAMRLYSIGGKVVMSKVILNEDREAASQGGSLCVDYYKIDMGYLHSLWVKNSKTVIDRSSRFEPFDNVNLLKFSQGPRGRWRGNGFFLYEKIIDSPRIFKQLIRGITQPLNYYKYLIRILNFLVLKIKLNLKK